jgi:curved DNA-binding protein CbpA
VPYSATHHEIKKAFHKLAIRYHPDVTRLDKDKAEEVFKDISVAYWILKDATRRKQYNRTISDSIKDVKISYEGPPPWETVEWIWDERQLRYRRKPVDDKESYEAKAPHGVMRDYKVSYPKPFGVRFEEGLNNVLQAIGFWFVRRVRIARLRYFLFLDWVLRKRNHVMGNEKPHKIRKVRSN